MMNDLPTGDLLEKIAAINDLNTSLSSLGSFGAVAKAYKPETVDEQQEPFDKGRQILSDVLIHTKYARHVKELGRRETYDEMVNRREDMDMRRWPELASAISWAYRFVRAKKVFPSMRSFQFAGPAIEVTNSRMFNCCYLPINSVHSFSETMFLLLGGSGVGYSVQEHHVAMLPNVAGFNPNKRSRRYLIQDSIEGWADAVKVLIRSAFEGRERPRFDFSSIRKKGALLVTSGGRAPGPEPLKVALNRIECILERAVGRQLTPLECHDILCFEADAVYAGGIRRAAMISFFSPTDKEMLYCKVGHAWLNEQPQRQRANNSAVLLRGSTSEEQFRSIMEVQKISMSGEPGIYWTNDLEVLSNPCVEAGLPPFTFCNLAEINMYLVRNNIDFLMAATAASIIGTLQASYTDFHYLRDCWREATERDALIGVGMTGLAQASSLALNFESAARQIRSVNECVAKVIGIRPAARCTLIKPSGTTSSVLGCSSGIHDWHDRFYVRRIRLGRNEPIVPYLEVWIPDAIEPDVMAPDKNVMLSIPIKAPLDAIIRTESSPLDLLEREKYLYEKWVLPGHREGVNTHSISITVSYSGEEQYKDIIEWMWNNRNSYAGISLFESDNTVYPQLPFESISEERYYELLGSLNDIYLDAISEIDDNTDLSGEAACAGGACAI